MLRSSQVVARLAMGSQPVYGVNTGFGALSDVKINPEDVRLLQENVVRSHAAGVGSPLSWQESLLTGVLRLLCLAQGYSGVRLELVEALKRLVTSGYAPRIPEQGSVGACGDLAPLAHAALPLLGLGFLVSASGQELSAKTLLKKIRLSPIQLVAKEGLALVNGTQASLAILLVAQAKALKLIVRSLVILGMSLDAFQGSLKPFLAEIARLRRHSGALWISQELRRILRGSAILQSHADCDRVQDPYSFRCGALVLGAAVDTARFVNDVIEKEANAITDNPIVLGDSLVSNGNFHGQTLSAAADYMRIALAGLGGISERRLNKLLDDRFNLDVPKFLTPNPGLESGLMMAQVTAAAIVSENKTLAHPQSVDSIPTNLDKEDHVSMSATSARFMRKTVANLESILACECLAAYRGLAFRRAFKSSPLIEEAWHEIKEQISPLGRENPPAEEIVAIQHWFNHSRLLQAEDKKLLGYFQSGRF